MKKVSILAMLIIALSGCGAPIFRSEAEIFRENPRVLEIVEPYLEDWATLSLELTRQDRHAIVLSENDILSIGIWNAQTVDGQETRVVDILLDVWGDWRRGYLYVHDGSELLNNKTINPSFSSGVFSYRRLSDTIYLYQGAF